jgi:hypothetical protein
MNYLRCDVIGMNRSEGCRLVPEMEFAPECTLRGLEQSLKYLRKELRRLNAAPFGGEELDLIHDSSDSHAYRC